MPWTKYVAMPAAFVVNLVSYIMWVIIVQLRIKNGPQTIGQRQRQQVKATQRSSAWAFAPLPGDQVYESEAGNKQRQAIQHQSIITVRAPQQRSKQLRATSLRAHPPCDALNA